MKIAYSEVFPILANALPGFEPSHEDRIEPTPYFFLGDMMEFVCRTVASGSTIEADSLATVLERLLLEGDRDVHDLVQDALEGLVECDTRVAVAKHFGPKTQELWNQVYQP